MGASPVLLLSLLLAGRALAQHPDTALRCKDHIAYDKSWKSVLVSSWTYTLSSTTSRQLAYLARYNGHVYAPVNDLSSNMYRGLDLFHTADNVNGPTNCIYFQRPAKVYMFVNVHEKQFDPNVTAALGGGWTPVGWAQRIEGDQTITYGVRKEVTLTRSMPLYAYVFAKDSDSEGAVTVSMARFIRQTITGIAVTGAFNLWIAEKNGDPSPPVGKYNGKTIEQNKPCPDFLHDAWRVKSDDPQDPLPGKTFSTWHPQWDPCFWCAYTHEHGSNAKMIMDYTPRFTYTALKNDNQNELDNGFKGFVLRTELYNVYFSLHIMQSILNRVSVRFHTINLVIKHRVTGELLADLRHKGDFGFLAVRMASGKAFAPILGDEVIKEEQDSNRLPRNFRSINVIDEDKPNPAYAYRSPRLVGTYEEWQTLPMCSQPVSNTSLLLATFRTPNTGIKSVFEPKEKIKLGRKFDGNFYQAVGLNRNLNAKDLKIGDAYCPKKSSGSPRGEVFYTDPKGKEVVSGPGPQAVRQFMKAGFEMSLEGRFEVTDTWNGLHEKDNRGFFVDHGYSIDPESN